jgi:hypothetical protein
MEMVLSRLSAFGFQVIPADAFRAVRPSSVKLKRHLPYLDAFGIELTAEIPGSIFVTADFDFKPASRDVKIEFLPAQ